MASQEGNPHEVSLAGAQLTAPSSWVRKPPRVDFILAEFALPRARTMRPMRV